MRHSSFAVFIMVHGRPDKSWTYRNLRKQNYTGKIFLVADDLDETVPQYREKYGDELLVFDKKKAATYCDSGDTTGDLRSTLFSANTIPRLAKERGIKHYFIMCDDYLAFNYAMDFDKSFSTKSRRVRDLDRGFDELIDFYETADITTLAMSQGGDFAGGPKSLVWIRGLSRKAMNSFLCSTEKPINFVGRMNEDATTYTLDGSRGKIFFTTALMRLEQLRTQEESGGLTDLYTDYGTHLKSFFTVMYNPSCTKISEIGVVVRRIHHNINWEHAVPKIISDRYKK